MISVVILGAGNVATHLFHAFYKAENIVVNQWFNRNLKSNDYEVFARLYKVILYFVNKLLISCAPMKTFIFI